MDPVQSRMYVPPQQTSGGGTTFIIVLLLCVISVMAGAFYYTVNQNSSKAAQKIKEIEEKVKKDLEAAKSEEEKREIQRKADLGLEKAKMAAAKETQEAAMKLREEQLKRAEARVEVEMKKAGEQIGEAKKLKEEAAKEKAYADLKAKEAEEAQKKAQETNDATAKKLAEEKKRLAEEAQKKVAEAEKKANEAIALAKKEAEKAIELKKRVEEAEKKVAEAEKNVKKEEPSGPSGSTAASVSVNLMGGTIDAFNAGKWARRYNARLTTTPIFTDTYPSEARTKMGEYIMPSFEKCRARDDCIALTVRGASVMGHATDTTLTKGSGVGFTLYKRAPKNENLVEIPTNTSFVVSDEAPVEEGNYIIDQRRFGRKCTTNLKPCFRSGRVSTKFKIQSVGDNKYAILNTDNAKYCDSDLVCKYDDAEDATREFSFKAATGDYHRYHDGRILDPDVKFYHMKGNTGWCGYLKSSGAGNPLDCTHETPEEFNYRIWGLKKV